MDSGEGRMWGWEGGGRVRRDDKGLGTKWIHCSVTKQAPHPVKVCEGRGGEWGGGILRRLEISGGEWGEHRRYITQADIG